MRERCLPATLIVFIREHFTVPRSISRSAGERGGNTEQKTGCLVWGKDLVYLDAPWELVCSSCGRRVAGSVKCREGHFICDDCHRLPAEGFIERACLATDIPDPLELALFLMRHPLVRMHGPEHHFLVPAALLTGYSLVAGEGGQLAGRLKKARDRDLCLRALGGDPPLEGGVEARKPHDLPKPP